MTYNIIGGSVLCENVGADEADLVEAGKAYRFVGGSIQGKPSIIESHSSLSTLFVVFSCLFSSCIFSCCLTCVAFF
jgi:hypothetical protein